MTFELTAGASLRMAPNDRWNQCLLAIRNLVDVTVRGGTLIGERLKHVFAPDKNGKNGVHDEVCWREGHINKRAFCLHF
jgi:poly(beta-D-mannuronate) C5 epimerase